MAAEYYIAFWNVENLFSPKNDPGRSDKLQRAIKSELNGWTRAVLNKKLKQLAKIIKQMNAGNGPDILGVCEVENRKVLDELVGELSGLAARSYDVVHEDANDGRGIDVAFIYDKNAFDVNPNEIFSHFILRRNATRDIMQATFTTKAKGNKLILLGNHWPSRMGGEFASEPYRTMAGETLAYFHQRIIEIRSKDQAVLAMGDFNDEPLNRSLVEYALAERVDRRVKSTRARKPYFLNLMWDLMGQGNGTHYYDGVPGVLDQFLVNRPLLLRTSKLEVRRDSVEIIKFPEMTGQSGKNKGAPRRFGRPSRASSFDDTGFSDHFPIGVKIREDD